jgi:hypothetical protein
MTYRPVLFTADPPVGRVHPVGVVVVTAPSTVISRNRPAVGVNAVPSTTVPPPVPFDGSRVCEVVPLRGNAMVTRLSQSDTGHLTTSTGTGSRHT